MPRYRLRHQNTDLELPAGEFVIGRSSSCNLALDDALVSRRHAAFRVGAEGVTVEDLGSRNGILVNGEKAEGAKPVGHLDRVTIGSQELIVVEVGRTRRGGFPPDSGVCTVCGSELRPDSRRCPSCGAPASSATATLAGQTLELKAPIVAREEETAQASGFQLISGIAEKALALGRFDEAQRILEKHLLSMQMHMRSAPPKKRGELDSAASFALRLADGLSEPAWIDWLFETYAAAKLVPPGQIANDLYELVRRIQYRDPRALREYLAALKPARQSLSPSDRFVLQRLEGLLRVVTA